ncbi:MAG: glycoside hydrolase domain-containing protein [Armatimonadota bacterium]
MLIVLAAVAWSGLSQLPGSAVRIGVVALVAALCVVSASAGPPAHAEYEPPGPAPVSPEHNLFLGASVEASSHWDEKEPRLAVDGRHERAGDHWAAENIPVWLALDLGEPVELNHIRLWTYWGDGRYYQYFIEGSLDGESWEVLADNRGNTAPAGPGGERFTFQTAEPRYVRVTFTHNSVSNTAGGHIVEIEGYALPDEMLARELEHQRRWPTVPAGLTGTVGSIFERYERDLPPQSSTSGGAAMQWSDAAWRGERVSCQIVLWSGRGEQQVRMITHPLRSDAGEIPASAVRAHFVRYVLADGRLVADVLDTRERLDLPSRSVRPVWVTIDVPADVPPGDYRGELVVEAAGSESLTFDLELEVQQPTLPPPSQWQFHLDLWQNPYAMARYHHVAPWSKAHLRLLEPHLKRLAQAGQKCATTTIVHQPWGTQTYDPYESMVKWVRHADGTWSFDYTDFDRYVELCEECGIREAITCYSMLPWTMKARYLDEATGDFESLRFHPRDETFERTWTPFIGSFIAHLRRRGWLERTFIAMDERPLELMRPALDFLREAAPELKVALAGSNTPELKDRIDDWSVFISPPLSPEIARDRIERNKPTTFYVCCGPGRPNTFTFSPPAEAAWLGWYAAAQGYSGFLRWAYDSWVEDPLYDTSYVTWPAGDCFLVYPGDRSSIRFEQLRDGIEAYEKVRLLRDRLTQQTDEAAERDLRTLDAVLESFTYERVTQEPAVGAVREARAVVRELSRRPARAQ